MFLKMAGVGRMADPAGETAKTEAGKNSVAFEGVTFKKGVDGHAIENDDGTVDVRLADAVVMPRAEYDRLVGIEVAAADFIRMANAVFAQLNLTQAKLAPRPSDGVPAIEHFDPAEIERGLFRKDEHRRSPMPSPPPEGSAWFGAVWANDRSRKP